MKNHGTEPEWHRPLRIEKIGAGGLEESIVANERERAALAARFGLESLARLEARLRITPEGAGMGFAVRGTVSASVVQRCVVTLEPLPADIGLNVDVRFAAPEWIENAGAERDLSEEDIEPIEDGVIDLGELAAQHLGLGLDPYPRKPGLPSVETEYKAANATPNPFAGLIMLKRAKKGEEGEEN